MKITLKRNRRVVIDGIEVGKYTRPYFRGDNWSFKSNKCVGLAPDKKWQPIYDLDRYRLVESIKARYSRIDKSLW